jgi:ribosomal protein L16/L10AE
MVFALTKNKQTKKKKQKKKQKKNPKKTHEAAESFCDFFFYSLKKMIINSIDSRALCASSIKRSRGLGKGLP